MLEPILQQLGAGNPQLAQLISANPEQFLQLLGEDGDDDAPLPPGAQAISVTEEERDAIERVSRSNCVLNCFRTDNVTSYVGLASTEMLPSRHISLVTRTRNLPPISCSTSRRTMSRQRLNHIRVQALCWRFCIAFALLPSTKDQYPVRWLATAATLLKKLSSLRLRRGVINIHGQTHIRNMFL